MTVYSLIVLLLFLILASAFFSSSETGMMAINRYRLRHLARRGNAKAKRVVALLQRPDRLIGVILIGNTFANILASSVGTVIAIHYFGQFGVLLSTLFLTVIILIFAETAPKTLAALHPRKVAFAVSRPLTILLTLFYPMVWFANVISNGLLRLLGIKMHPYLTEPLSAEELRTMVYEATGKISSNYQQMLLRILNLGQMTVEDVMVPRNEIIGIDITDSWDNIVKTLSQSDFHYMPIYRENIDHAIGILSLRHIATLLPGELTPEKLSALAEEVYYVAEVTLLHNQILNFQQKNKTIALVVDEYGDIQGLLTLQDILEEIVGEFAIDVDHIENLLHKEPDGSYLVDARISTRDLNRLTNWQLPTTEGPKTLSGLIIEHLETIPAASISLRLAGYPMEIIKVSGNRIRSVKVWPDLWQDPQKILSEE